MSKEINISDISDNDVLSQTIKNKYNQILLNKGTVLNTATHLKILKTWGINSVFIDTDNENNDNSQSEDIHEKIAKLVSENLNWGKLNKEENILLNIIIESKINEIT